MTAGRPGRRLRNPAEAGTSVRPLGAPPEAAGPPGRRRVERDDRRAVVASPDKAPPLGGAPRRSEREDPRPAGSSVGSTAPPEAGRVAAVGIAEAGSRAVGREDNRAVGKEDNVAGDREDSRDRDNKGARRCSHAAAQRRGEGRKAEDRRSRRLGNLHRDMPVARDPEEEADVEEAQDVLCHQKPGLASAMRANSAHCRDEERHSRDTFLDWRRSKFPQTRLFEARLPLRTFCQANWTGFQSLPGQLHCLAIHKSDLRDCEDRNWSDTATLLQCRRRTHGHKIKVFGKCQNTLGIGSAESGGAINL
jgi:hypothetical protein